MKKRFFFKVKQQGEETTVSRVAETMQLAYKLVSSSFPDAESITFLYIK